MAEKADSVSVTTPKKKKKIPPVPIEAETESEVVLTCVKTKRKFVMPISHIGTLARVKNQKAVIDPAEYQVSDGDKEKINAMLDENNKQLFFA